MSWQPYLDLLIKYNGTFRGATSEELTNAASQSDDPLMDRSRALMEYQKQTHFPARVQETKTQAVWPGRA